MTIRDFARYFHRSPDALGPEHIRQYQAYLFRERKLAANSVNQRVGALRFFFIKTLKKTWSVDETPYPKKVIRLPRIFSPEEVGRLIDSATTPFYRTILMTLYATGVRRAELTHLKVSDIDGRRMVIHVQGGKGRKDCDIMSQPQAAGSPSANIGAVCNENPRCGCSPAIAGTHPTTRSPPKSSGWPAGKRRRAPAWVLTSIRTRYATASPHICSKPAPTGEPSRFYWGIATWKKRLSTRILVEPSPERDRDESARFVATRRSKRDPGTGTR